MITLNIDLPHTDMDDFIEHFEYTFENSPYIFVDGLGDPLLQWDTDRKQPRPGLVRWDDTSLVRNTSEHVIIGVHRGKTGATRLIYLIEGEDCTLFILDVIRFRRDRLRVILTDFTEPAVHTPKFLTWLKQCWGEGPDGIVEFNPLNAPPVTIPPLLVGPDDITQYMANTGLDKDSPQWWNIYLSWVFDYRARNGKRSLSFKKAARHAPTSDSTFKRERAAWEKRTGRKRNNAKI